MKVFYIGARCDRIMLSLASAVRRQGGQAVIACPPTGLPLPSDCPVGIDCIAVGSALGQGVSAAASWLAGLGNQLAHAATARLIEQLGSHAPDIIHLFDIHGDFLNFPMLFDYLSGFSGKVIWTLGDCRPLTGGCDYIGAPPCARWKDGCKGCPDNGALIDLTARNYEQGKRLFTSVKNLSLVTTSEWLRGLVARSFMKELPCEVIHKGVDPRVFRPCEDDFRKRYGIEERRMVLGVADRWSDGRGLQTLIDLAARLDDFYQMVIAGVSERQLRALPPNIIGLRRIPAATELAALYTTADLLVAPAERACFPIVNVEALACGTPVIAYDVGGVSEALTEGCGAVVRRGDIDALLDAVNTRTFSREACIERARELGISALHEAYFRLYGDN